MKVMKLKILLAPLLLTAFLFYCKSVEKQRYKARQFYRENPGELAADCAEKFPPVIEYRPGKTVFTPGDTVRIPGDSVQCPDIPATNDRPARPGVKMKCPETKIITNTITRIDTVTIENTAAAASLRYQLDTTRAALQATRGEFKACKAAAKVSMWWIVVLVASILLGVFLRVKKII